MIFELLILTLLVFVASIVGTFSGFGTSTIMVPVMLLFFPLPVTLLFVGVIHWFGDIWKMLLAHCRLSRRRRHAGRVILVGSVHLCACLFARGMDSKPPCQEGSPGTFPVLYCYFPGCRSFKVFVVPLGIEPLVKLFKILFYIVHCIFQAIFAAYQTAQFFCFFPHIPYPAMLKLTPCMAGYHHVSQSKEGLYAWSFSTLPGLYMVMRDLCF